jgi:hypothetical protein
MYTVDYFFLLTDCKNLYNDPGPPFPDHFGGQPPLQCGRPSDPPRGQSSGWTMPDSRSKYPPASRHSMEPPVSHGGGISYFLLPCVVSLRLTVILYYHIVRIAALFRSLFT